MIERPTGEPPITEVFMHIQDLDRQLMANRHSMSRPEVRNLYIEKGYNVMLLLTARKNGHTDIKAGVYLFDDEYIHTYSQNRVTLIAPPNLALDNDSISSGLNLIAPDDSRKAAILIGNPDFIQKDNAYRMIDRTYEEIRELQREHKIARESRNLEMALGLEEIRLTLVEKVLKERHHRQSLKIIKRNGENEVVAQISFGGKNQYVVLPVTDEVTDLVEKYGGFDKDYATQD